MARLSFIARVERAHSIVRGFREQEGRPRLCPSPSFRGRALREHMETIYSVLTYFP